MISYSIYVILAFDIQHALIGFFVWTGMTCLSKDANECTTFE